MLPIEQGSQDSGQANQINTNDLSKYSNDRNASIEIPLFSIDNSSDISGKIIQTIPNDLSKYNNDGSSSIGYPLLSIGQGSGLSSNTNKIIQSDISKYNNDGGTSINNPLLSIGQGSELSKNKNQINASELSKYNNNTESITNELLSIGQSSDVSGNNNQMIQMEQSKTLSISGQLLSNEQEINSNNISILSKDYSNGLNNTNQISNDDGSLSNQKLQIDQRKYGNNEKLSNYSVKASQQNSNSSMDNKHINTSSERNILSNINSTSKTTQMSKSVDNLKSDDIISNKSLSTNNKGGLNGQMIVSAKTGYHNSDTNTKHILSSENGFSMLDNIDKSHASLIESNGSINNDATISNDLSSTGINLLNTINMISVPKNNGNSINNDKLESISNSTVYLNTSIGNEDKNISTHQSGEDNGLHTITIVNSKQENRSNKSSIKNSESDEVLQGIDLNSNENMISSINNKKNIISNYSENMSNFDNQNSNVLSNDRLTNVYNNGNTSVINNNLVITFNDSKNLPSENNQASSVGIDSASMDQSNNELSRSLFKNDDNVENRSENTNYEDMESNNPYLKSSENIFKTSLSSKETLKKVNESEVMQINDNLPDSILNSSNANVVISKEADQKSISMQNTGLDLNVYGNTTIDDLDSRNSTTNEKKSEGNENMYSIIENMTSSAHKDTALINTSRYNSINDINGKVGRSVNENEIVKNAIIDPSQPNLLSLDTFNSDMIINASDFSNFKDDIVFDKYINNEVRDTNNDYMKRDYLENANSDIISNFNDSFNSIDDLIKEKGLDKIKSNNQDIDTELLKSNTLTNYKTISSDNSVKEYGINKTDNNEEQGQLINNEMIGDNEIGHGELLDPNGRSLSTLGVERIDHKSKYVNSEMESNIQTMATGDESMDTKLNTTMSNDIHERDGNNSYSRIDDKLKSPRSVLLRLPDEIPDEILAIKRESKINDTKPKKIKKITKKTKKISKVSENNLIPKHNTSFLSINAPEVRNKSTNSFENNDKLVLPSVYGSQYDGNENQSKTKNKTKSRIDLDRLANKIANKLMNINGEMAENIKKKNIPEMKYYTKQQMENAEVKVIAGNNTIGAIDGEFDNETQIMTSASEKQSYNGSSRLIDEDTPWTNSYERMLWLNTGVRKYPGSYHDEVKGFYSSSGFKSFFKGPTNKDYYPNMNGNRSGTKGYMQNQFTDTQIKAKIKREGVIAYYIIIYLCCLYILIIFIHFIFFILVLIGSTFLILLCIVPFMIIIYIK